MNPYDDMPEHLTVTDDRGIPDHIVSPQAVMSDAFTLALAIGAADGDQETITAAISDVLTRWDQRAGYVFASAITQFSRDLLPMMTELTKTATGVDFAAHCRQMNSPDYTPEDVDR